MLKTAPYDISAVIRTWNSARTLRKTLQSLTMQNVRLREIVVVDSGSSDQTREIAEAFGCRVILYPKADFNYSRALNLGIEAAKGSEILIISSHTVLAFKDVLWLMWENLKHFQAVGVYCAHAQRPFKIPKANDFLRGQLIDVIYADTFNGTNGLHNSCSLVERRFWHSHRFDETMPAAEDQEWALWHFRNSNRPTVCIRNAGVLYLNPNYSWRKDVRDYAVLARRVHPPLGSWAMITRILLRCARSLIVGRVQDSYRSFRLGFELLKGKFVDVKYESKYV